MHSVVPVPETWSINPHLADMRQYIVKQKEQVDCKYVHDEVLYISSWLQLSKAVNHG